MNPQHACWPVSNYLCVTRIAEDPRKMAEEPRKNSAEDMNENIHRKEATNSAYGVMNSLFYQHRGRSAEDVRKTPRKKPVQQAYLKKMSDSPYGARVNSYGKPQPKGPSEQGHFKACSQYIVLQKTHLQSPPCTVVASMLACCIASKLCRGSGHVVVPQARF